MASRVDLYAQKFSHMLFKLVPSGLNLLEFTLFVT